MVGGLRTHVENSARPSPQYKSLFPNPNTPWAINDVENTPTDPQTNQPNWVRIFKTLMNANGGRICVSSFCFASPPPFLLARIPEPAILPQRRY